MSERKPVAHGLREDGERSHELAAHAVFERFTRRLIGLARSQLDSRFQHKVDPEDVIQSVYKSFLVRYAEGWPPEEGWDGLWGLLTCITVRKCADRVRYHLAERRDIGREAGVARSEGGDWLEAVGREPTPEEAAVLAETVEQLLRGLDGDERRIAELTLQGYGTLEISETLRRSERSVRRLRELIRKRLERMQREDI